MPQQPSPVLPNDAFFYRSLQQGCARLQLNTGIVSHVVGEQYYVVESVGCDGAFKHGDVFPLNDTWCRTVIEQERTVALSGDSGLLAMQRHPLYQSLPLQAYISTIIRRHGIVWGTVNFSNLLQQHEAFNHADIDYIEQLAQSLSQWLSLDD